MLKPNSHSISISSLRLTYLYKKVKQNYEAWLLIKKTKHHLQTTPKKLSTFKNGFYFMKVEIKFKQNLIDFI